MKLTYKLTGKIKVATITSGTQMWILTCKSESVLKSEAQNYLKGLEVTYGK